jgi:cytochrome b subunit of formate dehydrogenase
VRFTRAQRITHVAVMVSFLGLALTGVPLKFSESEIVRSMAPYLPVRGFGLIHRACAVITFAYFLSHLGYLLWRIVAGRTRGMFWGPDSMVPQPKDLKDLKQQFRWFFFMGPPPRFGRWTYWEKFDYWAVFWGVTMIGSTGLILWFPSFFAQWFPGWIFNVATIIHSEEALLAMCFIFTIHVFNTHLRPNKFPIDLVIFSGRMSEKYFREEHPEQYEAAMRDGAPRVRLAPEPTGDILVVYKIVGYCAFTLSVATVILIAASLILS